MWLCKLECVGVVCTGAEIRREMEIVEMILIHFRGNWSLEKWKE